jgi:hypothetical protein
MARTQIAQCDICGAHESKENPVGATVTLRGKKDINAEPAYSFFGGITVAPAEQLDLCMNCSAPLVHMLRDHAARRRQEERRADRVKPANEIKHDIILKMLGITDAAN